MTSENSREKVFATVGGCASMTNEMDWSGILLLQTSYSSEKVSVRVSLNGRFSLK